MNKSIQKIVAIALSIGVILSTIVWFLAFI